MDISNKCYVDFKAELARVPDAAGRQIKLEGDTIWVLVIEGERQFWVKAGWLKRERDAYENMLDLFLSELGFLADKAGVSKAELKRRLVNYGIISK